MSNAVVIVWKDKEGQLISTYRDEESRVRVLDVDTLDEQQGVYVNEEEELLKRLEETDGQKLYVPVDLARGVLGWDV